MNEDSNREGRNERDLYSIMAFSTGLGFGVLAAFLYSLRDIRNDVSLEFSWGTVVAFLVAAVIGWGFWMVVKRLAQKDVARRHSS